MPSVIKKVKADVAYELYVDHFPLKYKVSSKFRDDHTLDAPNLSKQTSIEAAIDRYKRNQNVKKSSWLLLDDKTLINKAKSANKGTDVHQGKQQITMQLVVTRRTVTIER